MLDRSTSEGAKGEALLDDAYVVWLTTVRRNGQPQSSPVWFVIDDGEFLVYSLDGTARTANIAANPRVSLNLDSNAGADVVTVEGIARIVAGPDSLDNAAYQEKYRSGIERIGHTPESFAARYSVPIRIKPLRWRIH
ncbi:MAG: TIGR03667 family PPOX class F420-dependent oxidoreductase [Acidimicrobiia bacterium]